VARRAEPGPGVHGLAVVDKPAGWTSHDVVARSRRLLGTRKVGHSGTLDPDATGVLLLGAGDVTRLLRFLGDLPKTYECEVVLGTTTSTLDAGGEITGTFPMSVTAEEVATAGLAFVGDIQQVPPMVSAIQIDGRRLHELAREGIEVERPARPVTIHALSTAATADPLVYRLEVTCSSGTYVRTLADDLGRALGGGAHLRALRRTAIGPHTAEGAVALDDLSPEHLLPPSAAVAHLEMVRVDEAGVAAVRVGKVLSLDDLDISGAGPWAVVGPAGDLLAVYEPFRAALAKPSVVLASAAK
jgi:tRNA pseudouridine55 synthase